MLKDYDACGAPSPMMANTQPSIAWVFHTKLSQTSLPGEEGWALILQNCDRPRLLSRQVPWSGLGLAASGWTLQTEVA